MALYSCGAIQLWHYIVMAQCLGHAHARLSYCVVRIRRMSNSLYSNGIYSQWPTQLWPTQSRPYRVVRIRCMCDGCGRWARSRAWRSSRTRSSVRTRATRCRRTRDVCVRWMGDASRRRAWDARPMCGRRRARRGVCDVQLCARPM